MGLDCRARLMTLPRASPRRPRRLPSAPRAYSYGAPRRRTVFQARRAPRP